ncbi:MAG: hypothetical protein Kow00127_18110 [Bacteroidales bacterium]
MKQVVIAGGGISGLTCAAYLARAGLKVRLIEKNNEFGGLVSSIEHNGFTFEAGVRALVNAGIILPMLNDLGIRINKVQNKVSIGIEDEIINIESKNDIEKYGDLLIKIYPASERDIIAFIRQMKKMTGYVDNMYKIDNPVFHDLNKDKTFFIKKLLPWLPGFLLTIRKINRLNIPVEQYVAGYIQDISVRDIITQHFFKATPAFFALGYFAIYTDYFYPIEGVGKLAEAVLQKALEFKAELISGKIVTEVDPANRFVMCNDGVKYHYDFLVWAADLKTFYNILDTGNLAPGVKERVSRIKDKINSAKTSESVFSLYLEVDLPVSYFEKISNGHFFYTPSKEGLNNVHTTELDYLLKNFSSVRKSEVLSWLDRFLDRTTYEISIPALRNPALAPRGKTGIIISFLTEYGLFSKVENAGWHEELKERIENKIVNILTSTVYPELRANIDHKFSFTPLSIRNRVGTTNGAIVGWSFKGDIPAVQNMLQVNRSVITPIPGIFQAGQWVYSPAGVPMSILSGKLAADKIIRQL